MKILNLKKNKLFDVSKKNITYVITRADSIGGAQIHVRDISLYAIQNGFKVTIITGGAGNFFDSLKKYGIKVIKIKSLCRDLNLINDLLTLYKLCKVIKKIKPFIISVHSSKAGALVRICAAMSFKFPSIIFTAHGWSFAEGKTFISVFLSSFVERFLACFTKKIITVCETDYKRGLKYKICRKNKLVCIHNGMPFYPKKIKEINENKKVIKLISIARFQDQKDHFTLLKGLSLVKKISWRIILIGNGPLKKQVLSYAKELGIAKKINIIKSTTNTKKYLDASDIFLLISNWEGFPRSILEALRSSMPIIASNVGGVHESVKKDFNGFLIQPNDANKIAFAIENLSGNYKLFKKYSKNSRSLYEEKYQFIYMAKKTLDLYYSIMEKIK